jgi:hypothetical protein
MHIGPPAGEEEPVEAFQTAPPSLTKRGSDGIRSGMQPDTSATASEFIVPPAWVEY